jgi:Alpha-L-fucosidase./F5/8 type C domain.
MKNQLTELLTNYGDIAELWLDGGWVAPVSRWGIDQLYSLTKKLQPKCAFGVNHTIVYEEGKGNKVMPDEMIKDNAYYFQYFPSDFRLWDPMIASKFDKKQYLHNGKSYYLPFEHTICLSKQWSWFQKSMPRPLREIDELEELFYWCTDNGNTLLLDVPPAYTGRIFEHEANQVISLGKRLGLKQGKPLPRNGKFISTNMKTLASSETNKNEAWRAVDGAMQTRWESADTLAQLIINLNPAEKFNKLSIFEYQDRKSGTDPRDYISVIRTNRIQEYNIDIWINDKWQTIYHSDESMDDCKVIRFPKKYSTCKIRLNVLKAIAPPSIFEFNVICNNK